MRERDVAIHSRGQELVELATSHFPQEEAKVFGARLYEGVVASFDAALIDAAASLELATLG